MLDELGSRRLLLIESHTGLRRDLFRALSQLGFVVEDFADARRAMEPATVKASAVQVIDLAASGAQAWLRSYGSIEKTIGLVSDLGSRVGNQAALPEGMDCLCKPFSIRQLEARVLARSAGQSQSASRNGQDPILETQEPDVIALLARARRLAGRRLPLVIEGELGTGRRALAEAVHGWSACAASPLHAIESTELEAIGRPGLRDLLDDAISAAVDGSVVIVEPVDLPEAIQLELLAAMRRFEDKGPRWLTVSRRPLEQAVREGRILLELQYRLDAARLLMPPLRDRARDHLALCQTIARRIAREMGEPVPVVDQDLIELLARDGFPGNRHGIESRLRSCMVRSEGDVGRIAALLSEDFEGARDRNAPLASLHLKTLERDTIIRALAHWEGNRTRASETLGISVRTLRNKIREYGLR